MAPYVGFVARFADGSEARECDGTWDTVPDKGITRLSLVTGEGEVIATLDGSPARRFFFANCGAAHRGGMGFLAGKLIGYVEGDQVVEILWDRIPGAVTRRVQGALRALGHAVNVLHEKEGILPLDEIRRRVPEVEAKVGELERAGGQEQTLDKRTELAVLRDAADALEELERVDAEGAAQVQRVRAALLSALNAAAEALTETEYDPRALWRSYPAAQLTLLPHAFRRGA